MKVKNVVARGVALRALHSVVETNVEKLAPVKFETVVGLFHNVDVIISDDVFGYEVIHEGFHVGHETRQMLRAVLRHMQIPIGNDDSDGGTFLGCDFSRHLLASLFLVRPAA